MEGCIWKVRSIEDRHCEYCTYGGACPRSAYSAMEQRNSLFERYRRIMNEIIGMDVLGRSRETKLVWARYIMAYQLRLDGFRYMTIGKMLNMHHASVIHGVASINLMLCSPTAYPLEKEIFDRFTHDINTK